MAAGDTTQGRRVGTLQELWDGDRVGEYFLKRTSDGEIESLWFKLPLNRPDCHGRLAATGHGQGGEPEWTITEEDDGTVTVSPSIEQHEVRSEGKVMVPYWHGYLERGVWREV